LTYISGKLVHVDTVKFDGEDNRSKFKVTRWQVPVPVWMHLIDWKVKVKLEKNSCCAMGEKGKKFETINK